MELTGEELARVREAYDRVAQMAVWEGYADDKARGERPALVRLMKAWNKLDIEERAAVSLELAQMVSPDADPHDLDVGLAATRAAEYGRGRAGAKVRVPGFREAVREAAQVWIDRGNEWSRGNIHRDTNRYEPYPMLAFVVDAVTRALPSDAIARATLGNPPSPEEVMAAVDSQLRP
ncbi:hypothetical protein [Jannaschia sp. CCS1]|uniref:hypothetical protein n=1 Tax=Jannaschia sp. (strain CCS1) TaxID=290400 RepID=UPI000053D0F4|nr:hypothetical protein [Jannaschia sp. CCS1]